MIIVYLILIFAIGFLIGYGIFYFRYEDKKTIDGLRENLRKCRNKLRPMEVDLEEYKKQNEVLKEEIKKLIQQNNDLQEVVGDLSRYIYHMKKASNLAFELNELLKEFNPEIEKEVDEILSKTEEKVKMSENIDLNIKKW